MSDADNGKKHDDIDRTDSYQVRREQFEALLAGLDGKSPAEVSAHIKVAAAAVDGVNTEDSLNSAADFLERRLKDLMSERGGQALKVERSHDTSGKYSITARFAGKTTPEDQEVFDTFTDRLIHNTKSSTSLNLLKVEGGSKISIGSINNVSDIAIALFTALSDVKPPKGRG